MIPSKQQVQICLNPESRSLVGLAKLYYTLPSEVPHKINLCAKQLDIKRVWTKQGDLKYKYPSLEQQAACLNKVLSSTKSTKELMQAQMGLWEIEEQQGGLLEITLPENLEQQFAVLIEYELTNPASGLRFFKAGTQVSVVTEDLLESKRLWMPCKDTLGTKYPLEIEIQVPSSYMAVCSGDLLRVFQEGDYKSYQYSVKTYIDSMGFVVAPIQSVIPDPTNSFVTHFTQTEGSKLSYTVSNSVFTYSSILSYISDSLGSSMPVQSQKLVFIKDLGKPLAFSGLSLLDESMMLDGRRHEGTLETAQALVETAATNWIGGHFHVDQWVDFWILVGLRKFLGLAFVGERIDPNYLRFQVQKQVEKYCQYVEKGLEVRPLFSLHFTHPNELLLDKVYQLKSGLIFHMIQSKVGKYHLKSIMHSYLKSNCTTKELIPLFKKHCGINLKEFSKTWIYGIGAPFLHCSFEHNRKNNSLDLKLTQTPLFQNYLASPANSQFPHLSDSNYRIPFRLNLMRFYTGPLTIIIFETDGYEMDSSKHVVNVDGETFYCQIPCKKRIRRPTNQKRREETEEEKRYRLSECPVLWVRVDPDFEMLRKLQISQNDFMWVEQIKKEKVDAISQIDAIKAVRSTTEYSKVMELLFNLLEDTSNYYRVRMEAAKTLAVISYPINAFKGLDFLIYYFKKRHYENEVLKPNDFSSLEEYYVDKAVLKNIIKVNDMSLTFNNSRIRVNSNFVVEFLAELLRNNDNSVNYYDDSFWRANLLQTLGSTTNPVYIEQIHQEMAWYLKYDLSLPSNKNIITCSVLKGLLKLTQNQNFQETYDFLVKRMHLYSPSTQYQILKFFIKYQKQSGAPIKKILQILVKHLYQKPEFVKQHSKAFTSMLKTWGTEQTFIEQTRNNEEVKNLIWELCVSPLSFVNHGLAFPLLNFYRYMFPLEWQEDKPDPQWQVKLDYSDRIFSQQLQPVDVSKGTWEDWAQEILKRLVNHECATPFLNPVDYVAEELWDYPEIVTNPMDFSTIQQKLNENQYNSFQEFSSDVRLVFQNCYLYNMEGSRVYSFAQTMEEFYNNLATPVEDHLSATQKEDNLKVRIFGGDLQISGD